VTRFQGLARTEVTLPDELIPTDVYLEGILDSVAALPSESVPLTDAGGRVLAEPVVAPTSLPRFPNSAMDGYAVRAADIGRADGDSPATLEVIGAVAAGSGSVPDVRPGTAVRIMTGAPVPPGADAVVPVEVTAESGTTVLIHRAPTAGEHIRLVGEDVSAGDEVVPAGTVVEPAILGMLAAVGCDTVVCHRRARVAVLSTGDELVPVGGDLLPGQLHDSNGPMLTALAASEGALSRHVGVIPDDPELLRSALAEAAATSDLVLLSGGVSAGAHDHLPDVLAELGSYESVRLAMKPGMPQARGLVDGTPVLGLPGNPVSSYVSFERFALPALRRLQGRSELHRRVIVATAGEDLTGAPAKRTFLRVRLESDGDATRAIPAGGQGSHVLSALAGADGLAEVPADRRRIAVGQPVRVHLLRSG
jgi:molybdopterin molybdotransferase